jgi:D-serine deaminase-like pyridoxal phosphate-dependent protein
MAMKINDLITPALLIEKNTLLQNIKNMAIKAHNHKVRLRPHIKTHKCLEIANLQREHGATGITVSTLGEASTFIENGFTDVTLAYPIIPDKFPRLGELAQHAQLKIVTDHPALVPLLEAYTIAADIQLTVLLKVDCGYHRCGISPTDSRAISLVEQIDDASNLTFGGILTHAGHAYYAQSLQEIQAIADAEQEVMLHFAETLQHHGFFTEVVSIGSTPTARIASNFKEGITEIRPGNYVFFDNTQVSLGVCHLSDCALSVLTSVVSVHDTHVVVDAGATVLSKDLGAMQLSSNHGYGVVLTADEENTEHHAIITNLSQEHGKITFEDKSQHQSLSPGDHLRIIPNHSCLTANLFAHYYIVDGNRVESTWPIHHERICSPPP